MEANTQASRETMKRYAICVLLTITVFGLGYVCGQHAEQYDPAANKAAGTRATAATSRASARSEFLQRQRSQRKAALLV